jgi:hypothetical protein
MNVCVLPFGPVTLISACDQPTGSGAAGLAAARALPEKTNAAAAEAARRRWRGMSMSNRR